MDTKAAIIDVGLDVQKFGVEEAINNISALCESIGFLRVEIENLMQLMQIQQIEDQWFDGISMAIDIYALAQPAIENYANAVRTAAQDVGTLSAMFPKLSMSLEIAGAWIGEAVKSVGGMIAQIAASTAAWIANTAVKVANTAAQWATRSTAPTLKRPLPPSSRHWQMYWHSRATIFTFDSPVTLPSRVVCFMGQSISAL